MRVPRISIAGLMTTTVVAGLYLAVILRLFVPIFWLRTALHSSLPTLALMTLSGPALIAARCRRSGPRPFLAGFAAFGALAVAATFGACLLAGDDPTEGLLIAVGALLEPRLMATGYPFADPLWGPIAQVTFIPVMFGLPQLLFAALGGRLNARYRVTITRRRDG